MTRRVIADDGRRFDARRGATRTDGDAGCPEG